MRAMIVLSAVSLLVAIGRADAAQGRTFRFTAEGFDPPSGIGPVSGRVTAPVGIDQGFRTAQVEAIELSIGGVAFTPANTTYEYDPSVDRLSIRGDGDDNVGFDLQIRRASAPSPGEADFTFYSDDGNYHAASRTEIAPDGR